jgi:hypothetical protein
MELKEMGCGGMDCINVSQDMDGWQTLVNAVMYFQVP